MKKVQGFGIVAAGPVFAAGFLLTACSAEPGESRVTSVEPLLGTSVEPLTEELQAVPDDASDFQAEVSVDAAGNMSGRRITRGGGTLVAGFDAAKLPRKALELNMPAPKISPSLASKLAVSDARATTEVVVAVTHDAPFATLHKLKRDQPRGSTLNQQRLATRVAQIAAVDSRRKAFRAPVIARARALGGVVTEELTMGNAIAVTLPNSVVEQLAADPSVVSIIPRYDGTPPPATISNGTSLATGMNSDFWRPWNDGALGSFYVVTFDTGIRSTHTVFNSADGGTLGLHRDCSRGNDSCLNLPFNADYNDQDSHWNHGTGVASIILGGNSTTAGFGLPHRGVSKVEVDYLNVYSAQGSDAVAVGRAFTRAALWGDDVIVGELQIIASDSSAVSLAADDAFDQGIATVAACGNFDAVTAPAAPGNAHKAMSVGDYHAVSGAVFAQVPGRVDGRIKPDFQAPTSVDAAGNGSNTAKHLGFSGTSGATGFAGGAAALMYEWYSSAFALTNKPGNLYTALLAQGDGGTMPDTPNGTGKLKMESGSHWWTGSITLGAAAIDLTFSIPASLKNLKVAIWWPEKQSDAHNDVDLMVLDPAGGFVGGSAWGGSVWEKVAQTGNLTPGNYTVRFTPFSLPRPNQVVYYTVVASFQ